jgi:hypothetical protein
MTLTANASDAAAVGGARHTGGLAVRFAWRDLRGGLRGFGVFIACVVLGVMTIAGGEPQRWHRQSRP